MAGVGFGFGELPARSKNNAKLPTSFSFDPRIASSYLLDKRCQRKCRRPRDADSTSMFSPKKMGNIQRWLNLIFLVHG